MLLRSCRIPWTVCCAAMLLAASQSAWANAPAAVADDVAAHVAAGEFGPALDLAMAIRDLFGDRVVTVFALSTCRKRHDKIRANSHRYRQINGLAP